MIITEGDAVPAAKPQDHKQKTTKPEQVEVTALGRQWTMDPQVLQSWDLQEAIDTQNGTRTLRLALGAAQYAELKTLLRDPDTGLIPSAAIIDAIAEIFSADNLPNR